MCLRAEMARFTCCRRAAIVGNRKERRVMAETDKQKTAPTAEAAGSTGQYQAVARDRRVDRTGDLRKQETTAIEAS